MEYARTHLFEGLALGLGEVEEHDRENENKVESSEKDIGAPSDSRKHRSGCHDH